MRAKTIQQLYLSAVIAFGVAVPSFAQDQTTNQAIDENLGDHTKYEAVITTFQKAVADHDAAGVAALVQYPIGLKVTTARKCTSRAHKPLLSTTVAS